MSDIVKADFYKNVKDVIDTARKKAYTAINFSMVEGYWNVGRLIVEEEQHGKQRAEYGKKLIEELSKKLTRDYGKGYTLANLKNMRQFYLVFSKSYSLCSQFVTDCKQANSPCLNRMLSWSHYRILMRIDNSEARSWYMNEAAQQNWGVRVLERQINTLYYERLILSKDKLPVVKEANTKVKTIREEPGDFIKDPYVLEFLNLKDKNSFRESELEQALIDKLQDFLLELGRGFAFIARQKRISTATKEYYIDLVFYNYHLNCFFLLDLKRGELTHQDIGQMDMYVRLFDELEKGENDNPTVGLILCREKDEVMVKYSMLKENKQLFASKYKPYLPSKKELAMEIRKELRQLENQLTDKK